MLKGKTRKWLFALPFSCLFCLPLLVSASHPTDEEFVALEKEIRLAFESHKQYVDQPLETSELLCRCTDHGCDKEIIEIAGPQYAGICRAHKGGLCKKSMQIGTDGHIKDAALSCVLASNLLPPERPFVCESLKGSRFTQKIHCCSNASFCNHMEMTFSTPETSFHWFIIMVFVAVFFSAVGLVAGIYCCSNRSKNILRNYMARITGNGERDQFMQARESYTPPNYWNILSWKCPWRRGGGDGLSDNFNSNGKAGMPLLAQRTIARQIELRECIGRGRFGEVFLGEWRGEKVAVKIFLSRDETSWQRETEIYQTNMLRHSNLLRWIASDNKDTGTCTQLWLITEYLQNGSVCDYLERCEMNPLLAIQFIRSIAHGLSYLHTEVPGVSNRCFKPGIAHRDIKTRNILVKNDMTCAIADLGLAVRCVNGQIDIPEHTYRGGTARYLAPEFLSETFVSSCFNSYLQMDVYAFALVMWEIARRVKLPVSNESQPYEVPYYEFVQREPEIEDMRQCVCTEQHRPTIPNEWAKNPVLNELTRIMCESWSTNPNSRLTALNIRYSLDALVKKENLDIIT
uniref:receptor protein serine/threonine kinase n=1 Tax=Ditylenchus dipsaci TaxID=166011 RepID=A0A915D1U7_9BILA